MRNKFVFAIISLLVAGLLAACGAGGNAGVNANLNASGPVPQSTPAGQNPRTVSVSGSGIVSLTPDLAYINIGVHTENADAAEALSENNAQAKEVVDALRAAGVAANDIQTSNFNIYPSQQYSPTGEITGTRYVVDNTVYVTVRSLPQLGQLLDTAVTSGANSINGITFDVADKTAALTQARKQALDNARALAEETAEAAGVSLGEIQSINLYSSSSPVPMFDAYGKGGREMAAASDVPISTGQMTISAEVSVVFEIE